MVYPPVVIVDANDNPTGLAMLKDAEVQGLLYRVVAVSVMDENGRILLQKRSDSMKIDPGTWDIAAGGHVDEGLTYETAAAAELEEELGIAGRAPQQFGKEFLGDCFLMLYTLTVPSGIGLELGADEVADTKWFTSKEFESLLRDHPEQCANFLKEIYSRAPAVFGLKLAAAAV